MRYIPAGSVADTSYYFRGPASMRRTSATAQYQLHRAVAPCSPYTHLPQLDATRRGRAYRCEGRPPSYHRHVLPADCLPAYLQ
jgi:hypothetical protein